MGTYSWDTSEMKPGSYWVYISSPEFDTGEERWKVCT